jgi:hypothetical protein
MFLSHYIVNDRCWMSTQFFFPEIIQNEKSLVLWHISRWCNTPSQMQLLSRSPVESTASAAVLILLSWKTLITL